MSKAIKGNPAKDKEFSLRIHGMADVVHSLRKGFYEKDLKTGKNTIHNLSQKNARTGFVLCGKMISLLIELQADLLARMDYCNEQGRGGIIGNIRKKTIKGGLK